MFMYCAIIQVAWKINSDPLCRCILQPPPTRGRGCSGQSLREDKLNIEQIIFKQCFGSGSTAFGRIRIHFNPRSGSRSGSTSISFPGSGSTAFEIYSRFRKMGSKPSIFVYEIIFQELGLDSRRRATFIFFIVSLSLCRPIPSSNRRRGIKDVQISV